MSVKSNPWLTCKHGFKGKSVYILLININLMILFQRFLVKFKKNRQSMIFSLGKFSTALVLSALLNGAAFAQLLVPTGATFDGPPSGTLSMGCGAIDVQGVFNVCSDQVSNPGSVKNGGTGAVYGGSGTISDGAVPAYTVAVRTQSNTQIV